MNHIAHIWRGLLAGVLTLAVSLALSGSARASCGDYVHLQHPATAHSMPEPARPETPAPPACPCRGPECRQQTPDAPLPPPTHRLSLPSHEGVLTPVVSITIFFTEPASRPPADPLPLPVACDGIFHPPR